MVFENSGFYLKEALHSIKRNAMVNIATFISFTTILIIVGVFLLISLNMDVFLQNMESQLEIVVYLNDDISQKELNALTGRIEAYNGIENIRFLSKEEAFEEFMADIGGQEAILNSITKNPLPASYIIKLIESEDIPMIAESIAKLPYIEEVVYGKGIVEKIVNISSVIRKGGLITLGFLVFSSILIISNIIKITVYTRKNEIEIMSLAGATGWFIRWPFIIAGFLQGILSATLALLFLYNIYFFTINLIQRNMPFLSIVWDRLLLLPIGLIILFLGSTIGIIGSLFSVGKYLNEKE